jgi:hypothetical protein
MSVVSLLVILIVIGVIIWAINAYLPMDAGIKKLISIVGIVIAVLYVLYAFGIIGSLKTLTVPHL